MMTTSAENEETQFRFVAFEGVKTVKSVQDADNKRDTRSHVRKSILRSYKTRDIQENLRFYVPPPLPPSDNSTIPHQKRTHAKKDSKTRPHFPNGACHLPRPGDYSPSHPFTAYICKHVSLPAERIDGLLKSGQCYTTEVLPNPA
jgi:hypothetical protein